MVAQKLDPRTKRAARELGRRMRAARREIGLSQEKLATKIGMTRSNYARLEQGTSNVTLDTLRRIADGLGAELAIDFLRSAARRNEKTTA